MIDRRTFIQASSALLVPSVNTPRYKLGVATTSYMTAWRPRDTYEFLEHCHALGAAGIQAPLIGDMDRIRARAEQLGMYIEAMVPMPEGSDTSAFVAALDHAKQAGATALRSACLHSRRYETFTTPAAWEAHVEESHRSIAAAVPLLEKYKIPLGIENHKDWTVDQLTALLKSYSSEYLGACLDFGNNIALLDDPMEVIEKLAPYTVTTHLKNMAVSPYSDGFLLSEVLLGDGYLDLPRAINLVRQTRPKARFVLEMITRDPLKVPCLSEKYWASFPDRNGVYLARTMRFVQANKSAKPLPQISQLSHDQQVRVEDQNVAACLKYAHEHLDM